MVGRIHPGVLAGDLVDDRKALLVSQLECAFRIQRPAALAHELQQQLFAGGLELRPAVGRTVEFRGDLISLGDYVTRAGGRHGLSVHLTGEVYTAGPSVMVGDGASAATGAVSATVSAASPAAGGCQRQEDLAALVGAAEDRIAPARPLAEELVADLCGRQTGVGV